MAAGDRLLDTSGNQILDASGNVFLSDGTGDDCCCDPLGGFDPCALCSGDTPPKYTVTISGVTVCGCVDIGSGFYGQVRGSPNQTWDLPYNGTSGPFGPCNYRVATGVYLDIYTDSGCTTFDHSLEFYLNFYIDGANIGRFDFNTVSAGGGSSSGASVFWDSTVDSNSCTASPTATNQWVAIDCGFSSRVAYGGSASLTPG